MATGIFLYETTKEWELRMCLSLGSGCATVGKVVESSHQQKIILNIYRQLYWKDEKEARNGPLKRMRCSKR